MPKTFTVFVLRGQPFHTAHQSIIEDALKRTDRVIVVIGSAGAALNLRNPWTYAERKKMIFNTLVFDSQLGESDLQRLTVIPLRDFMYNDAIWMASLQQEINKIVQSEGSSNSDVELIGHYKDDTSEYLNMFPQWKLRTVKNKDKLSSTNIRADYFQFSGANLKTYCDVSESTAEFMRAFTGTERYAQLVDEFVYIKTYKKSWEKAPFPPTFVTVDAIVMQAGHILVVKRGINPGKGKYALPGGFLGQTERILDAAIRELKEETKITVPRQVLIGSLKETHTFDHPQRSSRGRTITHAHFFVLDDKNGLPQVKGDDDASEALWMPVSDIALNEENFHEDHTHIIAHFVYKGY